MDHVGDITAKLAAVDEAIRALPDDAFAEKHELLKQQDALRAEAARYAADIDAERPDADLLAELSGLRSQLAQFDRQRIDLVTQAGGGASGTANMGNLGGVALNARMAEATGAGRIQSRIGVIKGILSDRSVDVPQPDY
jgi:hypothetical protein